MKTYSHFIGGKWKEAQSTYDVINPYNQKVIAKVSLGTKDDAKAAIAAARKAFPIWSKTTPATRAEILLKIASLLEKNIKRLARLESQNQGKTIKYAQDSDFPFLIDNLKFFAGAARMLDGKAAQEYSGMGTSYIRREPIGVCASIIPWNYPLFIAIWQIAPALAAGNTVVAKPASLTPLTLLEFCSITKEAGLPDGVLNVITGPGHVIGEEFATNPDVDMLTLTGDTETGKKIMRLSSSTLKRLHLELGGKAPMIMLDDADIESAAQGAVVGAFWNAGQDCTAVTRVFVPKKHHDELVKKMTAITKQFRLGDQLNHATDMGPLVSKAQREKVEKYVNDAVLGGARVIVGGSRPKGKLFDKGFFYLPTILTNVTNNTKISQEEVFGPVVVVIPYTSLDTAIKEANDVRYGLASSVWGKDIYAINKVVGALQFGTVWVNEHGALCSEMPHGGYKQSGFGKDLSLYSLEEYTHIKHVYMDNTAQARKSWHYVVYGKK